MTREEFNRKANDGTLTVGDVLRNREYATAELLAELTGGAVHINPDVLAAIGDAARYLSEMFDEVERGAAEDAADLWGAIAEDVGTPQR